jgi:hypothetical protein
MFDTKKVISKEQQQKIDAEIKLKNQEGFIKWLEKMNNVHQANVPRMHRALDSIL